MPIIKEVKMCTLITSISKTYKKTCNKPHVAANLQTYELLSVLCAVESKKKHQYNQLYSDHLHLQSQMFLPT